MRGRKGSNVANIAKRHKGGGHIGAAAFVSDKNLPEIEQLILTEFRKELKRIPKSKPKLFTQKKT